MSIQAGASAPLGATVRTGASTSASSRSTRHAWICCCSTWRMPRTGARHAAGAAAAPHVSLLACSGPGSRAGTGLRATARTGPPRLSAGFASTRTRCCSIPTGCAVAVPDGYDRHAASGPETTPRSPSRASSSDPRPLRLGRRSAAPPAVCADGHLRDARRWLHQAPELWRRRRAARHLRRADREDPLPAGPGHHGRRAAAGLPVRSAARPERRRTTGATSRCRSSRRTTPTARVPTRSACSTSSGTWSRRSTAPASR